MQPNPNLVRSNIDLFYPKPFGHPDAAEVQGDTYNQAHHQLLEEVAAAPTFQGLLRVIFNGRQERQALSLLDSATGKGGFLLKLAKQKEELGIARIAGADINLSQLEHRAELERLGVELREEDIRRYKEQDTGVRYDIVTLNNPIVMTDAPFVTAGLGAAFLRTKRPGLVMVQIEDTEFGEPLATIPGELWSAGVIGLGVVPPLFAFNKFEDYPDTRWSQQHRPIIAMVLTDYQPRAKSSIPPTPPNFPGTDNPPGFGPLKLPDR